MSIASEITRLYGVRSDIFTAITNKGVQVPAGSQLDDAPTLIGNISGGGGGGSAYTIDYTNPSHCTITGPNCARSGATINLSKTLDTNWVLDYFTLNGSSLGSGVSSFTMPAIDSTVSAVVHEVSPVMLKLYAPVITNYAKLSITRLSINSGTVPTTDYFIWGKMHASASDTSGTSLTAVDFSNIINQNEWSSGYEGNVNDNGAYLELALAYLPVNIQWYTTSWASNQTIEASIYQGQTTYASRTYTQPMSSTPVQLYVQ